MKKLGLWAFVGVAGVMSCFVLSTFWQYIVFAILFAVIFSKNYMRLSKLLHPNLAALVVVLSVLVLLVVPTFYIVKVTIDQAPAAYGSALHTFDEKRAVFGYSGEQVRAFLVGLGEKLKNNVLENAGAYIGRITSAVVGLFIMFITLFFLLRDGPAIYSYLVTHLPTSKRNAKLFAEKMEAVIRGVLLGQVGAAVIQGLLSAIGYFALSVPNALFWGVVTIILSIIPIFGPFLVYMPIAGYLILEGRYAAGILLLLFGTFVLSQIDNIVRPLIAARASDVHPLIVVVGVLGGLQVWGLAGFVLGPLFIAAFIALYDFALNTR